MALMIDEPVTGTATHVFVLGVSRYRHLQDGDQPTREGRESKLKQLSSAARSASEFAAWVMNEYHKPAAPLATLEICLAPAEGEVIEPSVAAKLATKPDALNALRLTVMTAWLAFRDRCLASTDSVAIVYVAGHGVQLTKTGATLLLEDFGGPGQEKALHAALDMVGLHAGLNNDEAAAHQFWFVDACRQLPTVARRFETLEGAYAGDEPAGQCQSSPLFLASGPKDVAWARPGGVSLFCEALLGGLRGLAAVGPKKRNGAWHISTARLSSHLSQSVRESAQKHGRGQTAYMTGHLGEDEPITFLPDAPVAEINIDLVPTEARVLAAAALSLNGQLVHAQSDWPLKSTVRAGLYLLDIEAQAPFRSTRYPLDVQPPSLVDEVEVLQ